MNWFKKTIRLVRKYPELNERQLNAACALAETSQLPLWKAIHQLLDTAEENAVENAAANMEPPGLLAGYVGGIAQLRLLRADLYARRDLGLAQREEKGDVKSEWLRKQVEPSGL